LFFLDNQLLFCVIMTREKQALILFLVLCRSSFLGVIKKDQIFQKVGS
jgi:hypothetical protein